MFIILFKSLISLIKLKQFLIHLHTIVSLSIDCLLYFPDIRQDLPLDLHLFLYRSDHKLLLIHHALMYYRF